MSPSELAGGCQCGAVRYRAGRLGRAGICHCRMCQKAFGSFFGPLVTAYDLVWTRGAPTHFRSSDRVRRGFCVACGTPLTYEVRGEEVELAIGTFDDPRVATPVLQVNPADRLPFFEVLASLPMEVGAMRSSPSYQHPDHDTEQWPAPGEHRR